MPPTLNQTTLLPVFQLAFRVRSLKCCELLISTLTSVSQLATSGSGSVWKEDDLEHRRKWERQWKLECEECVSARRMCFGEVKVRRSKLRASRSVQPLSEDSVDSAYSCLQEHNTVAGNLAITLTSTTTVKWTP